MHEDSWSRNNVGGIMKQESSRRNTEGESWRRKHGGVILEEETFSKPGGGNMEEEKPGAARSSQEQLGAARSSQEQPGAAKSSQKGTWLQILSNLISD